VPRLAFSCVFGSPNDKGEAYLSAPREAMQPRSFSQLLQLLVLNMAIVLALPVSAQQDSLKKLVDDSLAAMNAGNWQESLTLSAEAIKRHGKNQPLENYGPQFGVIYYRKGLCEMKLKQWDEAMLSFEVCYRDFPNRTKDSAGSNNFQKLALLKWGEAAMGNQKWEVALRQFKKFTLERDRERDTFSQGLYHINCAVCHARLGQIPMAIEHLEIAMKNRATFGTPDEGIIAAFEALATASITAGNEQALLDCIQKNRGELTVAPALMHRYSQVFLKLAGEAISAGMIRAALAIYTFVPDTTIALEDAIARPGTLSGQEMLALQADLTSTNSPEIIKLTATAFLHEKFGNLRGAIAAYQQLEKYHPHAGNRETNLFNLIRNLSPVEEAGEVQSLREIFLKDFPQSSHVQDLQQATQK
jgi:tetratricopeptide (TPR) repeat protein